MTQYSTLHSKHLTHLTSIEFTFRLPLNKIKGITRISHGSFFAHLYDQFCENETCPTSTKSVFNII